MLCAVLIALIALSAQITIPLGPVPFTLQVGVVVLVALLCSPREALCALCGYVLLGAIGFPVFSGAHGGIGVLMGPTGGFIYGFIVAAVCGAVVRMLVGRLSARDLTFAHMACQEESVSSQGTTWGRARKRTYLPADIVAAVMVITVIYLCGVPHLAYVAHMDMAKAFAVGAAPFIVLDICKAIFALAVAYSVRRATQFVS